MNLYPALDLRGGKVVRLRQGDPSQQTVYGDNPVEVAQRWIDQGARWLHVINLDGAFLVANDNEAVVSALTRLGVPIQFGGGLRTVEDVRRSADLGVARTILGTLAVEQPDTVRQLVDEFGAERIVVALDSKDGQVTTRGWQHTAGQSAVELGQQFAAMGVRYALYTDVSRDGELSGVNVAATIALARDTGLKVIASGGVASLDDVRALLKSRAVEGAILGTALYRGLIDLREALQVVSGEAG
jgi:phosphoribosylformimino-5-aminoimidazole carboxamide ribotide isomerase